MIQTRVIFNGFEAIAVCCYLTLNADLMHHSKRRILTAQSYLFILCSCVGFKCISIESWIEKYSRFSKRQERKIRIGIISKSIWGMVHISTMHVLCYICLFVEMLIWFPVGIYNEKCIGDGSKQSNPNMFQCLFQLCLYFLPILSLSCDKVNIRVTSSPVTNDFTSSARYKLPHWLCACGWKRKICNNINNMEMYCEQILLY